MDFARVGLVRHALKGPRCRPSLSALCLCRGTRSTAITCRVRVRRCSTSLGGARHARARALEGPALLTAESVEAATPAADGWGSATGSAALELLPVERVTSALVRVYLGRTLVATATEPAGTRRRARGTHRRGGCRARARRGPLGQPPHRRHRSERPGRRALHRSARHRELARVAHPLPTMRDPDRRRAGRLGAALLRRRVRGLPPHRSGGDRHRARSRRPAAARLERDVGALPLLAARRVRRAGGVVRVGRRARDLRRGGRPCRRRRVPGLAAVAVPGLRDGRLHREARRRPGPRRARPRTARRSSICAGSPATSCGLPATR